MPFFTNTKVAPNPTPSSLLRPATKSFTVTTASGLRVSVGNDVIECSGPGCDKAPTLRCSACKMEYYCSKACQRRDWTDHKELCEHFKELRTVTIPTLRAKGLEEQPSQVVNKECGICLTENMTRPLTLETCNHAFCYPCLKQWDDACDETEQEETKCPLCRSPFDLYCTSTTKWIESIKVARLQQDPNVKRAIYNKALEEFDETIGRNETNPELYVLAHMTKAKMCTKIGDAALAKKIMEKNVLFKGADLPVETWSEVQLTHVEALIGLGQYYSALKWLENISLKGIGDDELEDFLKAYCRCWYEFGNWSLCIKAGLSLVDLDSRSIGAHKYLALGLKEEGDMKTAMVCIGQSILYELDDETGAMDENIRIFNKFKAEEKSVRPLKVTVRTPPKYATPRCEMCLKRVVDKEKDIQFRICEHAFCYECMKKWWIDLIEKSPSNMPVRYKGEQSSCPICRKDIENLPIAKKQLILCNPAEVSSEPFSCAPPS